MRNNWLTGISTNAHRSDFSAIFLASWNGEQAVISFIQCKIYQPRDYKTHTVQSNVRLLRHLYTTNCTTLIPQTLSHMRRTQFVGQYKEIATNMQWNLVYSPSSSSSSTTCTSLICNIPVLSLTIPHDAVNTHNHTILAHYHPNIQISAHKTTITHTLAHSFFLSYKSIS